MSRLDTMARFELPDDPDTWQCPSYQEQESPKAIEEATPAKPEKPTDETQYAHQPTLASLVL